MHRQQIMKPKTEMKEVRDGILSHGWLCLYMQPQQNDSRHEQTTERGFFSRALRKDSTSLAIRLLSEWFSLILCNLRCDKLCSWINRLLTLDSRRRTGHNFCVQLAAWQISRRANAECQSDGFVNEDFLILINDLQWFDTVSHNPKAIGDESIIRSNFSDHSSSHFKNKKLSRQATSRY